PITNARGRTSQQRTYYGGAVTPDYATTSFTYDRLDRQVAVTDVAGNTWTTTYDLRGRATSQSDPDKGTITKAYDDAGQMLTARDARGVTLAYTYDALGRMTGEFNGSTGGSRLAGWTYDTLAKGQLTSATRYEGGRSYTKAVTGYNDRYQPLGTTVTIPASEGFSPNSWTTTTAYNADGSVASTTYPAVAGLPAETVTTTYDAGGTAQTLQGQDTYVNKILYWYFD